MDRNRQQARSEKAERVMQNFANAATIIGAVVALLSDKLVWLLPAVAAIALMIFALKHGRWAAALVSLVVVAAAALVGVSSYWNLNVGLPSFIPGISSTQTTSQPTPPNVETAQAEEGDGTPGKVFEGEVVLEQHASVDVDRSPAQVMQNQDGAVGEGDLYLDPAGLPGTLYAYGSSPVYLVSLGTNDPEQAYAACSNNRNASPYGFVSKGSAICFKTSQGRMAWAAIAAVTQPIFSEPATAVTLRVMVWDR